MVRCAASTASALALVHPSALFPSSPSPSPSPSFSSADRLLDEAHEAHGIAKLAIDKYSAAVLDVHTVLACLMRRPHRVCVCCVRRPHRVCVCCVRRPHSVCVCQLTYSRERVWR